MEHPRADTTTAQTRERRREVRLPCTFKVAFAHSDAYGEPVSAHIVEISKTGLQLNSDEPLSPGSLVTIETGHTIVLGEVRHCEPAADRSYTVGVLMYDVPDQPTLSHS